jgi:uncharacterized protein YndB with AHSA1/START domain
VRPAAAAFGLFTTSRLLLNIFVTRGAISTTDPHHPLPPGDFMPDRFDCISTNLLSRRNVIIGSAGALLAIVGSPPFLATTDQATSPSPTDKATRTFLHQEIDLKTTPARLYAVLLDSKQFSAFSHLPADIQSEPGGAFSMFGARILGRNVEIVPNQRIVQAWRSAGWDPGVYSIVRFEFKAQGTQTRAILDHTGFPAGDYDNLSSGWKSHYWDPLQLFFP